MAGIFPRFALVVGVMLLVEGAIFAVYNRDLLALNRLSSGGEPGDAGSVQTHAAMALERSRLTRQHLETISSVAQRYTLPDLELQALERLRTGAPDDSGVSLRLADAYRRARRFPEAEALYRALLVPATSQVKP
jgi:hypothetical protein